MNRLDNKSIEYPLNLLDAIASVGLDEPACWVADLPQDIDGTVEYVLASLTERERDITHLYYRDGLDLGAVGKRYNVTRERVRQVLAKALRKLAHPSRRKLLVSGISGYGANAAETARQRALTAELERTTDTLANIADYLAELMHRPQMMSKLVQMRDGGREINPGTPIKDLELSVRTYNVLMRAGITTVGKVISCEPEKLKKLRNMGNKSFTELWDKIHGLGLKFKGEDDDGENDEQQTGLGDTAQ